MGHLAWGRRFWSLLTLLGTLGRADPALPGDARSFAGTPAGQLHPAQVPAALEATPRPDAAAMPVVPLPTSTVTYTTTPPLLQPVPVSPNLEPGLVGELFDFDSKTSTVAVIDHTVHHWGDLYSALAIKWTGLLFIRQPGLYRFQITCMGAAELRIDSTILIKEDTLLTQRTNIPSNPVTLPAGHHAILIGYTELQGQAGFAINYLGPDTMNQLKLIPAHALMHEKGPCDLRVLVGADKIACGSKDRPRWALSSGESCQVRCSWGRYPMGVPDSSSFVSCHNGQLSRPDFKCSPVQCSQPKVANIGIPGCEEGSHVDDGASCTPRCAHGFGPVVSQQLTCHNGTMSGSFLCQPRRSCMAPAAARIANGGTPSCLTGRDDYVPKQYLDWAKKLQAEAPVALDAESAKRCVAKELGLGRVEEAFKDWSSKPIGSASIGQVYQARLRSTGEDVAIKVQMPGAERLFRVDIRTLKIFTRLAFPWAVDHISELEKMFESEFDYTLERENMEKVRTNVAQRWGDRVIIPKTFPELCTRRVLCMQFLDGEKLVDGMLRRVRSAAMQAGRDPDEFLSHHLEALRTGKLMPRTARSARWRASVWKMMQRVRGADDINLPALMEQLMRIHGEQVFVDGLFNADPHPGNVMLLHGAQSDGVGLIDFGQVKELSLDFRVQLAKLIIALSRRDEAEVVRLDKEMGSRTQLGKADVRYRVVTFWLDRDTDDVTSGQSFHDFLAWAEEEDPLVEMPRDLHLVMRCSCMIRNLALSFGIRLSTSDYWKPEAEALLRKHGVEY